MTGAQSFGCSGTANLFFIYCAFLLVDDWLISVATAPSAYLLTLAYGPHTSVFLNLLSAYYFEEGFKFARVFLSNRTGNSRCAGKKSVGACQ